MKFTYAATLGPDTDIHIDENEDAAFDEDEDYGFFQHL